jgi:hypothetical protein
MNRQELFDWLSPFCDYQTVALIHSVDEVAWLYGPDADAALEAWKKGSFDGLAFTSTKQDGLRYSVANIERLGVVLHRSHFVSRFCIDLDDHSHALGPDKMAAKADEVDKVFGAQAIRFTSRSGSGLHLFYSLEKAVPVKSFVSWAKEFGFNGKDEQGNKEPECFPKSEGLSQVYLPNDPNEKGGDTWTVGMPATSVVRALPKDDEVEVRASKVAKASKASSVSAATTPFGRQELEKHKKMLAETKTGSRNNQLSCSAFLLFQLAQEGEIAEKDVRDALLAASETNGLLSEKRDETEETIRRALEDAKAKPREAASFDLKNIYYDHRAQTYWFKPEGNFWIKQRLEDVKRKLGLIGFSSAHKSGKPSEVDFRVQNIVENQSVEFAGPLAGHRMGFYQEFGQRLLVTSSPAIIEPQPGECPTINKILSGLLGEEQLPFFLSWLKIAYESLRSGDLRTGQSVALVGPRNAGKSVLQDLIVTPVLGGRSKKAYAFLAGKTEFNGELFGCEHLMVEDDVPTSDLASRRAFGCGIKAIAANTSHRWHRKCVEADSFAPFWRLTISVNNEPECLLVLPPIDESLGDKIFLFLCEIQPMPMPTVEPQDRKIFAQTIANEIPAFCDFLVKFKIPPSLKDGRFGVRHYHHPRILEILAEMSPETRLSELIDGNFASLGDTWVASSGEIENVLRGCNSRELDRFCHSTVSLGIYLSRLVRTKPGRFSSKTIGGRTIFTILKAEPQTSPSSASASETVKEVEVVVPSNTFIPGKKEDTYSTHIAPRTGQDLPLPPPTPPTEPQSDSSQSATTGQQQNPPKPQKLATSPEPPDNSPQPRKKYSRPVVFDSRGVHPRTFTPSSPAQEDEQVY